MPDTEVVITILDNPVTLRRLSLRGWSGLENLKKEMDDAISKKDFDTYFVSTIQFIEMALSPSEKIEWSEVSWWEFLEIYSKTVELNKPTILFPILDVTQKKEGKKMPWEYDGRSWYFWLNLFADRYGWNETTIGELDIDTAIGLYQEIELNSQLEKEWSWGLSEIAYQYNSSTKKSEYKPLDRPEWMLPISPKQLPVIRMRKDMMPMGNIVNFQEPKKEDDKRGI